MFDVILFGTLMAFSHRRGDILSKQVINQASKKSHFTVDLVGTTNVHLIYVN